MPTGKITYSCSRTINIGNYESIKEQLSFTVEVEQTNHSVKGTISESQSSKVDDMKEYRVIANKLIKSVNHVLDKRESKLREWAEPFTELDFDTLEKLPSTRKF